MWYTSDKQAHTKILQIFWFNLVITVLLQKNKVLTVMGGEWQKQIAFEL